jgi:hypothetical protein
MKFLEKFSMTIYKAAARKPLMRFSGITPEKVMLQSLKVLDSETIHEIKTFIINQQTESGGFMDKAGKSDLYYSLFGYFVAEALNLSEIRPRLKHYLEDIANTTKPEGIHLHSAAILFSKLGGVENMPPEINDRIRNKAVLSGNLNTYSTFLNLLTFYYAAYNKGLYRVQQQLRNLQKAPDAPCTITAAILVLQHCFEKPVDETIAALNSFYLKNGSFAAVKHAPVGDLLSTAVALYALRVARADIRKMTPDCLEYVDSLYSKGGFCATSLDHDPDVEYTFYGLLALGALSGAP